MKRLRPNPVREQKERVVYFLFYYFIISFLFKTVYGVMTDSRSLLVSGIFSIFGIMISIVTLMRLGISYPFRKKAPSVTSFNQGKIESVLMLGTSAVIAITTGALILSIGHLVFFHTLYPPQLMAAWIAAGAAAVSLVFMEWIWARLEEVPEGEAEDITFVLKTDFILSILVVTAVVFSRMGTYIIDYACAIFASFFIVLYSTRFLYVAFKGLMDASCDKQTVSLIEKIIRKAQGDYVLKSLRVSKVGHLIEVMAFFSAAPDRPIREIKNKALQLKNVLKAEFAKPHELFVNFSGTEGQ